MAGAVAARLGTPTRIGSILVLLVVCAAAVKILVGHQVDLCTAKDACRADHDLELVSQANVGFWIRVLFIAGCVLLYLMSQGVPALSRRYTASGSMIVHLGWTIAAFEWVAFGALESTLGICSGSVCISPPIETLRLVAPLLIAVGCFLHGLHPLSSAPDEQRRWSGRAEALLSAGFIGLAATLLVTSRLVDGFTSDVQVAFSDVRQRSDHATQVTNGYWLTPTSETGGSLGTVLDAVPWLLFGVAYLIALRSSSDLGVFFRRCPNYPPSARAIGAWVVPRWDGIHAWIPLVVTLWLFATGVIAASVLSHASASAVRPAGRALALLPLYIALLFPAVGWSVALVQGVSRRRPDTSKTTGETAERAAIIQQTAAARWVLLFVSGLLAGNVYLALRAATSRPDASPVNPVEAPASSSGFLVVVLGPEVLGFAVVAFVCIALHYFLLLEWPYSRGQQAWKAAETRQAATEFEAARSSLSTRLAATRVYSPDQTSPGMIARYLLGIEQRRVAGEIPVHTFKGFADVIRKVGEWAGTAAAGALLGHQSAADVAQGGLDAVVKLLVALFVGRAAGS
jgi:hypothetical protein